jgi:hypothetical protein
MESSARSKNTKGGKRPAPFVKWDGSKRQIFDLFSDKFVQKFKKKSRTILKPPFLT